MQEIPVRGSCRVRGPFCGWMVWLGCFGIRLGISSLGGVVALWRMSIPPGALAGAPRPSGRVWPGPSLISMRFSGSFSGTGLSVLGVGLPRLQKGPPEELPPKPHALVFQQLCLLRKPLCMYTTTAGTCPLTSFRAPNDSSACARLFGQAGFKVYCPSSGSGQGFKPLGF